MGGTAQKSAVSSATGHTGSGPTLLLCATFLTLAALFLWGPDLLPTPTWQAADVSAADISTEPRRRPLSDPPVVHLNGYDRTCADCHLIFPSQPAPLNRELMQHREIRLDHGSHVDCLACHDRRDRNRLVIPSQARSISFGETTELCASCHRTIYTEWTRRTHGRTNGFWDTKRGDRKRLECTECHDPHTPQHPAMDPLQPLPAPQKLHDHDSSTPGRSHQ